MHSILSVISPYIIQDKRLAGTIINDGKSYLGIEILNWVKRYVQVNTNDIQISKSILTMYESYFLTDIRVSMKSHYFVIYSPRGNITRLYLDTIKEHEKYDPELYKDFPKRIIDTGESYTGYIIREWSILRIRQMPRLLHEILLKYFNPTNDFTASLFASYFVNDSDMYDGTPKLVLRRDISKPVKGDNY